MTKQTIERYWNHEASGTVTPKVTIKPCTCGKLPSYYASSGGFNYYGYYKCNDCNIFATGRHQFPSIGIPGFGDNENNEPKLFVVYNGENNPENGWNEMIAERVQQQEQVRANDDLTKASPLRHLTEEE